MLLNSERVSHPVLRNATPPKAFGPGTGPGERHSLCPSGLAAEIGSRRPACKNSPFPALAPVENPEGLLAKSLTRAPGSGMRCCLRLATWERIVPIETGERLLEFPESERVPCFDPFGADRPVLRVSEKATRCVHVGCSEAATILVQEQSVYTMGAPGADPDPLFRAGEPPQRDLCRMETGSPQGEESLLEQWACPMGPAHSG